MKEKYLADRKALMDAAQNLLNEGKLDEFKAKKAEVEALDAAYEAAAKEQANLNALNDKVKVTPLADKTAKVEGGTVLEAMSKNTTIEDTFDSPEYKNAFMRNVLTGATMPSQFMNVDANTKTTDVGTVIPTTTLQKIIEKLEATGMILPLVTRTSYQGGVAIPTSTVKPTATWVTEGSTSDKQKKTTGSITFTYFKLRCAISVSLEVSVTTYPMFETVFVNNVTEAMTKAIEQAIINGGGTTCPKGILTETVVTGQNVDLTEGTAPTYADMVAMEAALPLAYENDAVWFMTKKTFMTFIGMVDSNKQPIARVNYGINGRPERTLLGRAVICNDYMSSYASSVTADTIIAFLFNPKDYVLNTNYAMTVKRYEDNDTDDLITKAVMLADGKVVDKNSLVTMTIKNAA